jgi:hypothetical protein
VLLIPGKVSEAAIADWEVALGTQLTVMLGGTVLPIVPEALVAAQISSGG